MHNRIVEKLTSRKFWAALISFVTALLTNLGAQGEIERVTCICWAGASLIAYIVGEGLVDYAAVKEQKDAEDKIA